MTSDSGDSREQLDERLAAARDSVLLEGEEVIAQEAGDHGQAIVLTNMRVLIIKVGITATGVSNGKVVGEFPIPEISSVNVRKGPLGAVIQVCTDKKETELRSGTPDNVIVFTGPKRMRACESIAAKIESVLGKPLGRFEPPAEAVKEPTPTETDVADAAPEPVVDTSPTTVQEEASPEPKSVEESAEPIVSAEEETSEQEPKPESEPEPVVTDVARGGRQPRSLAEEIFAEVVEARAEAEEPLIPPSHASQVEEDQREQTEQSADVEQPAVEFRPNPKLPKPVRRRSGGNRILALFGLLIAALAVGVAAIVPMKVVEKMPTVSVNLTQVTNNAALLRRQLNAVSRYASDVHAALEPVNHTIAEVKSALESNTKIAPAVLLRNQTVVEQVWRKLDEQKAPPGLAGAKELLVSGLFATRTALADLATSNGSNAAANLREILARISEARSLIDKGLTAIENTREEISQQLRLKEQRRTR